MKRKAHRASRPSPGVARAKFTGKARGSLVTPRQINFAKIIGALRSRAPQSKYKNVIEYIGALKKDAWLSISVIKLARMLMYGEWQIKDLRTKKDLPKDVPNPDPVVKLFKRPNPFRDWSEFMNRFVIHWAVTGDAYILKAMMSVVKTPTELWLLEPQYVEPIPHETDFLAGYKYKIPGQQPLELAPGQVEHSMYMANPEDPYHGMGIVEMGETHFNITTAMEESIWSFFIHGSIPDGVLSSEDAIDEEQLDRILEQFEERHRGATRSHKPLVLQDGMKYEPGSDSRETDFAQTGKDRRSQTLGLAGIPPLRVGLTQDLNFASAYMSDLEFIQDTYTPIIKELGELFTRIAQLFGPYEFHFPELKPITDPALERTSLTGLVTAGVLTPNQVREKLGEEKSTDPAMDQYYMPLGNMPITGEALREPAAAPPEAPPAAPPPPAENALIIPNAGLLEHKEAPTIIEKRPGTSRQRRVLQFMMSERRHLIRALARISRGFFRWQRDQVIDRLLGSKSVKGVEDIFDMSADAAQWGSVTRRFFSSTLQEEYEATMNMFGAQAATSFQPGMPEFTFKLERLAERVTAVTETTRAKIAHVLSQGFERGLSPTEIAQGTADGTFLGIAGEFDKFAPARAQLIARTESVGVMDQAATQAYRGLGVTTCDIIGCEDNIIMPGQQFGCNSVNVPIEKVEVIEYHPNHKGAPVPQMVSRRGIVLVEDPRRWSQPLGNRVLACADMLEKALA